MDLLERIEPTLETVTPGDRLGPYEHDVVFGEFPDYVDGDAISWEWLRLPDGRQAVPHSLLFEEGNRAFSLKYLAGRKLNARIAHTFLRLVVAPVRVSTMVEIERTYIRRGREHVEFMAYVRDEQGDLLMTSHNNWVMNSSVRHEQDTEAPHTPASSAARAPRPRFTIPVDASALVLEPETELEPLERNAVLNEPPGGHGPNSVHGDEYARRVLGVRGAIVLGSSTLGYVNELLGRHFGPSWLERGSLDVRFTGPVVRNDLVTAHARVTGRARDSEGERLDLEVWVTNETGEGQAAIVGTAGYRL